MKYFSSLLVSSLAVSLLLVAGGYYWFSTSATQRKKSANSKVHQIKTSSEFEAYLKENQPVIAKFYANWCLPCQTMTPVFEEAAHTYSDKATFVALDMDNSALASLFDKYANQGVPTFVFFAANGTKVKDHVGAYAPNNLLNKDIEALFNSNK